MTMLFTGLVIGSVMGLTGAGGALVAIPLFMGLYGLNLKEATGLSLLAVVFASFINLRTRLRDVHYKQGFFILIFSFIGTTLSAPFKLLLPDQAISLMIATVSGYSLWGVWREGVSNLANNHKTHIGSFMASGFGLLLGVLTTFTGLGGGVLIVPFFLNVYRFTMEQAIATGLFVVGLSAGFSHILQVYSGLSYSHALVLLQLFVGILGGALIIQVLQSRLPQGYLGRIRKLVFTSIVVISLLKIL